MVPALRKVITWLLIYGILHSANAQGVYYLRTQVTGIWDSILGPDPIPSYMDIVFGAGNWNMAYYQTLSPTTVFNCSTRVVYMEGSDNGANIMNTFITTHASLISSWVNGGGQLLINVAPNEGGNIDLGFGGVLLNYNGVGTSSSFAAVSPGQSGHPLFTGPYVCGVSWTGGYFAHATLSGGSITALIDGNAGVVLAEKNWGLGKVLFGTITWPTSAFQSPQPGAANLRLNMLSCVNANLVNCADILSVGVSQTLFCAGDSISVTYTTAPTFFSGNNFVVELSDASGSFVLPLQIGSITATSDSTILAFIPDEVPYGTGYRIRVVADNPVRVGPDNGVDFTIYPKPVANFHFSRGCREQPVQFIDASHISSGAITSYTYSLGDGSVTNLANPVYAYFTTGVYSVMLTVTSDAGCSDSVVRLLQVHDVPTADFSVSNHCNGETTSLANTSVGAISYLWKFGDGNTSVSFSPLYSYNSPGTYQVTLIAENADGCTDSIQHLITVYPKPNADFSFENVCPGVPMHFTNLSTISGGSFTSEWYFGDGNTSNAVHPTNTYPYEGTYQVWLIVNSSFFCRDTSTKVVEVYPVPMADFNVSNVCFGTPSTFYNTSLIRSGGMTYRWEFGDGTTSGNADPVKIYQAPGIYHVTLTAISNHGCTDTFVRVTEVYQQPIAGFYVHHVCLGDTVNFVNTTIGTSVSFQWSFGDGYFSAAPNPQHVYNSAGTYLVRLISKNLNQCADTFLQQVTVYPQPIVAFSGNDVCWGNPMQFHNQTYISTGTLNYTWHFGDGTTSYNPEPTKNYQSPGTYQVRLVAVSNYGCKDSLSRIFHVYPQPIADFIAANVCLGDSVYLVNHSQGTGLNFLWQLGDGHLDTTTNPVHYFVNHGEYLVKLTATNGMCIDSVTRSISVYAQPVSAFSANDVCLGNATTFHNHSVIAQGLMNFQWHFGDGSISMNPVPFHTYLNPGNYQVSLVAYSLYGCSDTSYLEVHVFESPKADFQADDVCSGHPVLFQNNSTASSLASYAWTLGDGNSSIDASVSHSYSLPGVYNVSLLVENPGGCRDSVTKTITVYPTPVAAFSVTNVCEGTPSQFVNQTTLVRGTMSFYWDLGDGSTSTDINPIYQYNNIGIYTTTLIATTNEGCSDTTTQTHVVFPNPQADFSANVACYGQTVSFSNTSVIAFGTMTYHWHFGDGHYSTDESPTHVYHSLGVYPVQFKAISDQGCFNETQRLITVYPTPHAHFFTTPVCENDTVRFTNLSYISSGSMNFIWQLSEEITLIDAEPQYVFINQSGYIPVRLIAMSTFGCSDTTTKDVLIYPRPVAAFSYSNVCMGESVSLLNNSTVLSGHLSNVFWKLGDEEVSHQYHVQKTYRAPGSYRVVLQVVSDRGCVDSVSKVVVVYPSPDATIRPLGKNPFCFGDSIVLSSGTLTDSFEWSTGETTQTITVNYADYFSVTVTSQHGCRATAGLNTVVYSLPPANAGSDTTISKGLSVPLRATGGLTYRWSPAQTLIDANSANPIASPGETTTYTVTVIDEHGCSNTDDVTVYVEEDYLLWVTNVITPNNDGANDRFEIININTYPDAELLIFDRWGTELYRKKPYDNLWDGTYNGKPLPEGTYYYVIRFAGSDKLYKGSVSILR